MVLCGDGQLHSKPSWKAKVSQKVVKEFKVFSDLGVFLSNFLGGLESRETSRRFLVEPYPFAALAGGNMRWVELVDFGI